MNNVNFTILAGTTICTDVTERKRSAVTMTSPFGKKECEMLRWWVDEVKKKFTHILFSLLICLRVGKGFGYSMFSHGNLSRALDLKTPPPLSLTNDGRQVHTGVGGARGNLASAVRLKHYKHENI